MGWVLLNSLWRVSGAWLNGGHVWQADRALCTLVRKGAIKASSTKLSGIDDLLLTIGYVVIVCRSWNGCSCSRLWPLLTQTRNVLSLNKSACCWSVIENRVHRVREEVRKGSSCSIIERCGVCSRLLEISYVFKFSQLICSGVWGKNLRVVKTLSTLIGSRNNVLLLCWSQHLTSFQTRLWI